jgi:adenylate cyclase
MALPAVGRKLAAILAVDVVGYSRLMGADEAGTHARLKALRHDRIEPAIAAHHGRTVRLMGDGALVEFGSVVDAVQCAVAIQRSMAERNADTLQDGRIDLRIGVNLGDVIVEGDDIYGDGVNVAARLEGLAEPGGICVSRTVFDHVRNKVDLGFEDRGEHQVEHRRTSRRVPCSGGPQERRDGRRGSPGMAREVAVAGSDHRSGRAVGGNGRRRLAEALDG